MDGAVCHESDPDEDDEVAQNAEWVVVVFEAPAAERGGVDPYRGVQVWG